MSRRRRSPDPGATQQPVQNQRGRQLQASNWYPDPVRRHQYRYWNGTAWTEHVADAGRQSSDPLTPVTPVTPVIVAAPPEKCHLLRNAAIAVGAVALGLTAVVGAPGAGAEGPALAAPLVRETPATTSVLDTEAATGESCATLTRSAVAGSAGTTEMCRELQRVAASSTTYDPGHVSIADDLILAVESHDSYVGEGARRTAQWCVDHHRAEVADAAGY
jgi:hypothetical protein